MSDDNAIGRTVFIVDDDAAVRDSLMTLLEAYGIHVQAYDSVAAFRRGYRFGGGACLILDQHMPAVTGLEFLASAEGRKLPMPVILITAQSDKEIRAQAEEAGVFAFLAKPVAGDELMAAIDSAIARGGAFRSNNFQGDPS